MFGRKAREKLQKRIDNQSEALSLLTDQLAELRGRKSGPTMNLPVVDTAGVPVLEAQTRSDLSLLMAGRRFNQFERVSLNTALYALEELLDVKLCYSQNDAAIVIYERDET